MRRLLKGRARRLRNDRPTSNVLECAIERHKGPGGRPKPLGPTCVIVGSVSDEFFVRFRVRGYEVDTQGHLNWAQYLHYAEQARWEYLAAAGITQDVLLASGMGPAAPIRPLACAPSPQTLRSSASPERPESALAPLSYFRRPAA